MVAYIFTYFIVTFQKSLSTLPLGGFHFWAFFLGDLFRCILTKYIEIVSIQKELTFRIHLLKIRYYKVVIKYTQFHSPKFPQFLQIIPQFY